MLTAVRAREDPHAVRPLLRGVRGRGDVYKHWPGKTVTEYDDHLFCLLTMNHHPLHLDAHYAEKTTDFGKNVVVGNYIYSLLLGMSVPDVSGKAIANLEVESLKHVAPTFHGDTIYGETTVLDKTESKSKDDRGVVHVETRGYNQDGVVVCVFRRKVMVPKRSYGDARGGEQPGRPEPQRGLTGLQAAARSRCAAQKVRSTRTLSWNSSSRPSGPVVGAESFVRRTTPSPCESRWCTTTILLPSWSWTSISLTCSHGITIGGSACTTSPRRVSEVPIHQVAAAMARNATPASAVRALPPKRPSLSSTSAQTRAW